MATAKFQVKVGRAFVTTLVLMAVAAAWLPAQSALAGAIPQATIVQIQAQNTQGSKVGSVAYLFPTGTTAINGEYDWSLPAPKTIYAADGTTVLGTVESLGLAFNADPAVAVDFDVIAGGQTTQFTITSSTITFAPMADPQAFAHASVTVLDANSDGYANLKGLLTWETAFEARYNGANAWANLIMPQMVFSEGASATAEEGRPDAAPSTARDTVPGSVSSISVQFKFSLSASDSASGTGTFDVVPEPATLLLLAGGSVLLRRRRR